MIKVIVLYPNREDTKFDMDYYLHHHIPLVSKLAGAALKGVTVERGLAGQAPGSPPAFAVICNLLFDSVEAFQASFGPHAQEIMDDIPRYTDSIPTVQISEVKL